MSVRRHRPTVFTESRLLRTPAGRIVSSSAALSGREWTRGLKDIPGIRLAARVARSDVTDGHPVDGTVIALPYYLGLRAFIVRIPSLVAAIVRAVRDSSVVIVRLPGPIGLLAGSAAILHRRPLAVDVAGDAGEVWRSLNPTGAKRHLGRLVESYTRRIIRSADAVRYVTERTLQARYPSRPGVPTVGYSAVRLSPEWLADSAHSGSSPHPTVLAVGTQEQMYKGHDTLIRAFKVVRDRHPSARLILIGGGRKQPVLKKLAADIGIGREVSFLGHISDRDTIRSHLDSAWVFVQPSRTEGLPRALVEAMARGKACVGTDAGGIPELLPPGCIVPIDSTEVLASRLSALLANQSERIDLGRTNLVSASAFTTGDLELKERLWQDSVATLLETFNTARGLPND